MAVPNSVDYEDITRRASQLVDETTSVSSTTHLAGSDEKRQPHGPERPDNARVPDVVQD